MKLMKLSFLSIAFLTGSNINCNPTQNVKHIAIAITKTASHEGACPEGLKVIANMYRRGPVQPPKAAQALKQLSIEDKAFVIKALIQFFFDETNRDPFAKHVDAFLYFHNKVQVPEFKQFVEKLKNIKFSTNANEIRKTIEAEGKNLVNKLQGRYPNIANRMKADSEAFVKSKGGKTKLSEILVQRAMANKVKIK